MCFERMVCGFDGSQGAEAALELAVRLLPPHGRLVAVTARDLGLAALAGLDGRPGAAALTHRAQAAHAAARERLAGLPGAEARLVDARAAAALLATAEHERADLLAVGASDARRGESILRRRVSATVLQDASCTVLVGRGPVRDELVRGIVVAVDGTPPSLAAATVARELADRLGSSLRAVVCDGAAVDAGLMSAVTGRIDHDERPPVAALADASVEADLLVVGSRGLHGLRALGSVSERVAQAASCPVLVVRRRPVVAPAIAGRFAPAVAATSILA